MYLIDVWNSSLSLGDNYWEGKNIYCNVDFN